jgi:L,D-transpeptidase YcbB
MRNFYLLAGILGAALLSISCKQKQPPIQGDTIKNHLEMGINLHSEQPFDSADIAAFYKSYPELTRYEKDVREIYRQHDFNHIWFDRNGIIESGNSLYGKVKSMDQDAVTGTFPYQKNVDAIFEPELEDTLGVTSTDLILSNLFLFYAEKVYKGVDDKTTKSIGWLLPRKQVSYASLLDSVMLDPERLNRDENNLFPQYYKLRDVLKRYRELEKKGGWNPIAVDPKLKFYKPGDTAVAIRQIRERLFITGDLKQNSKSNKYDAELIAGIKKYQKRNGLKPDTLINQKHIAEMNVPIGERIKKIMVNMERCRWISPGLADSSEFIVVNIPSFKLNLFRNGKIDFESPVVVGAEMTKTVIFSGNMTYIVFSPYWNVPQSIINKDVKPGMARNKNYLAAHNMEIVNGQVRQKPGKNNSLGQVKFIFPNSNNIYLHDTPSKSLFDKESRAFSHGCVRVGKPRDLAINLLRDDPAWTPAKIDAAMNAGVEKSYTLKKKVPVYIGYFTAWVDENGEINFFDDIYQRDERLANIMMK